MYLAAARSATATRATSPAGYLNFAYPTGVPNPLPAEIRLEAELAVEQAKCGGREQPL
jgi:hypothetical protein